MGSDFAPRGRTSLLLYIVSVKPGTYRIYGEYFKPRILKTSKEPVGCPTKTNIVAEPELIC